MEMYIFFLICIVHMGDGGMRYFCSKLQQQPKQQMIQVKDIDLQSILYTYYI